MTDGIKRALRNFGNLLGNCLYDKEYAKEIVKIRVPPVRYLSPVCCTVSFMVTSYGSRGLTRMNFTVDPSSQTQLSPSPLPLYLDHLQPPTLLPLPPPSTRIHLPLWSRRSPGTRRVRCAHLPLCLPKCAWYQVCRVRALPQHQPGQWLRPPQRAKPPNTLAKRFLLLLNPSLDQQPNLRPPHDRFSIRPLA